MYKQENYLLYILYINKRIRYNNMKDKKNNNLKRNIIIYVIYITYMFFWKRGKRKERKKY